MVFSALVGSTNAAGVDAQIEIIVAVPKETPADAQIFITGNLIDNWSERGRELSRRADGTYAITLGLPVGSKFEYKFHRGNWFTVEMSAKGEELPNRVLQIRADRVERLNIARWADDGKMAVPRTEPKKSTLSGNIKLHDDFESAILQNKRSIIVYLPPGYDKDPDVRYPVLYMHDGQNVFDDATSSAGEWRADETAEMLIQARRIEPIIIVGIYNTPRRVWEYTPSVDPEELDGGDGPKYARFLIDELKPFIDQTYRTKADREHTAIAGSSLGGLISLWIGANHSDVFSRVAAVSPSLWWGECEFLHELMRTPELLKPLRVWVDMGTDEGSPVGKVANVLFCKQLVTAMKRAGLTEDKDFKFLEVKDAQHNERAWSDRFDKVLLFLFGLPQ
jgi:predicted alpha/beta superfamily hydrolase